VLKETFTINGEPCRKIPLTRGLYAIVDADKYEGLMQYTWRACRLRKDERYYAVTWMPRKGAEPKRTMAMHQMLLPLPAGMEADHENREPRDNRLSNLRPSTRQQNGFNRELQKNNTLGFNGLVRRGKRFRARIKVWGKNIQLGTYGTPEGAARAYDKAALKYFGQRAFQNFPMEAV
jgi:hypothetical protein